MIVPLFGDLPEREREKNIDTFDLRMATDHRGKERLELFDGSQWFDVQCFARAIDEQLPFVAVLNLEAKSFGEDLKATVQRRIVEKDRQLLERFEHGDQFANENLECVRLIVGEEDRAEEFRAFDELLLGRSILEDSQERIDKARRGELVDRQTAVFEKECFQLFEELRQTLERLNVKVTVKICHDRLEIGENGTRVVYRREMLQIFIVDMQCNFTGTLFEKILLVLGHG